MTPPDTLAPPSPGSGPVATAAVRTTRRTLFVRDLALDCAIGIHPHERRRRQRVVVNAALHLAEPDAPHADRIAAVVSYEDIVTGIERLAEDGHINLVETLAERIAGLCLADPRVRRAEVRVDKPDVYDRAAAVGVEIACERRE